MNRNYIGIINKFVLFEKPVTSQDVSNAEFTQITIVKRPLTNWKHAVTAKRATLRIVVVAHIILNYTKGNLIRIIDQNPNHIENRPETQDTHTHQLHTKNYSPTKNLSTHNYNALIFTYYMKNLHQNHREKYWNDFIFSLNFKEKSIYKLNRPSHKTLATIPLKTLEGRKVYDKGLKSELFVTTMKNQFKSYRNQDILVVENTTRELVNSNHPTADYTTTTEVWKIISRLLLVKPQTTTVSRAQHSKTFQRSPYYH